MFDSLNDWIRHLAYARKAEAEYREEIEELKAEIAASPLGQRLAKAEGLLATARADVYDAEARVRDDAVEHFTETGDKHPHPEVTVIERRKLDYVPAQALDWCKAHLPNALSLKRSLFEKHARAVSETAPISFVTIVTEPATRISSDLSGYLPEED